MNQLFLISFIAIFLTSCATHSPAPVLNRSPQGGDTATAKSNKAAGQDWRPNSYTVKKGDTLFSIGLEYGYDYREIAEANNITDPFIINVGQKLNFSSLNTKDTSNEAEPKSYETEDGVVISPIKTDDAGTATGIDTGVTESVVTPVLAGPKATRQPYSLEALNRKPTEAAKPIETKEVATVTPAKNIKSVNIENLHWMWPTPGKVTTRFNAASNKGINIAGSKGQEITATGKGKVIYAGSDLRGYGKLVIVKHNKTFLSVYAHNSKISVKEGQTVKQGQKIAEMGDTDTNTVKLHFEIRRHGKSVDPAKYLPQN